MRIQWRNVLAAVTFACVFLLLTLTGQGQAPEPLSFFKNYFITGDYVVGGVGLAAQGVDGIAQGDIEIQGVPPGAEVMAAFLYAQVVSDLGAEAGGIGVSFHGVPLSVDDGIDSGSIGVIGDPIGATPCWSSGGGTGQSGGKKRTYSYRYDVLRFLPVGDDGRHQVNGLHPIELPDLGKKKSTPIALGASLVVIYKDPNLPLSAFVIYDGSWVMDNSTGGMTQTIEGFYDPANVGGKMTFLVGSGQANKSEVLQVGQSSFGSPFTGSLGGSWDNVTVATDAIESQDSLVASVVPSGSSDCLTGSAIIYQTTVPIGSAAPSAKAS